MSPFTIETNCRFLELGQIVAFHNWKQISLFTNGTNCRFLRLGRNNAWDELLPNHRHSPQSRLRSLRTAGMSWPDPQSQRYRPTGLPALPAAPCWWHRPDYPPDRCKPLPAPGSLSWPHSSARTNTCLSAKRPRPLSQNRDRHRLKTHNSRFLFSAHI